MKRIVAMLLCAVMCMSLVACGGKDNSAQDNSTQNTPAPTFITIELTVDNWDTYFEFVEIPVFKTNDFGEVDRMDLDYRFQLKDEYYDRLIIDGTQITVENRYAYGQRHIYVDFDAQTYTKGDYLFGQAHEESRITDDFDNKDGCFYTTDLFGVTTTAYKKHPGGGVMTYENCEVLRIQGTLCLLDK